LLADDSEETSSIIKGMKGNAGKGIKSGVSGKKGNAEIRINERSVWIEDRRVAAHGDEADINGKVK
jgi:ribosomal protein S3